MKYLKTYENLSENNVKNKILIIDCSGSFIDILKNKIDKIDLYLADKFTAIFCDHRVEAVYENINLEELIVKILEFGSGMGGIFQAAIKYINERKLEGNVLIFTDGWIEIDLSDFSNNIAILATEDGAIPRVIPENNKCQVFYKDLESLDNGFYPPRDITYENYELKRNTQKYNI